MTKGLWKLLIYISISSPCIWQSYCQILQKIVLLFQILFNSYMLPTVSIYRFQFHKRLHNYKMLTRFILLLQQLCGRLKPARRPLVFQQDVALKRHHRNHLSPLSSLILQKSFSFKSCSTNITKSWSVVWLFFQCTFAWDFQNLWAFEKRKSLQSL